MAKHRKLLSKVPAICLAVVLGIGILGCGNRFESVPEQLPESNNSLEADYQAIYLTTDTLDGFEMKDFQTYRGLATNTIASPLTNLCELEAILKELNTEGLQNVFLHIEPMQLLDNELTFREQLDCFANLMQAYPDIKFEVLLDYPYIYSFGEELEEYCKRVEAIGGKVNSGTNGVVYYMGAEEWLTCNSGNYIADNRVNKEMALKILLYNFCDRTFMVNQNELKDKLSDLIRLVEEYQSNDIRREQNTEQYYIFLGDSIFSYEPNSSCFPEVFFSMANVPGANCSEGGVAAAHLESAALSLQEMIGGVLAELKEGESAPTEDFENTVTFKKGLAKLRSDREKQVFQNRSVCFVLQYGFNDYFNGAPVGELGTYDNSTYIGALENSIREIQEFGENTDLFEEVDIMLMVPGFCSECEQGTMVNGDLGGELVEYRSAVERIAKAYELKCVSFRELKDINAENSHIYLSDKIHPGPQARFEMAVRFAKMVEETYR